MKYKICTKCRLNKLYADFYKCSRNKTGITSQCKDCMKQSYANNKAGIKDRVKKYHIKNRKKLLEYQRNYRINNKEKIRISKMNDCLKRRYGITLAVYNKILKKQNNLCAICEKASQIKNRKLAVDHNHATGKIRGLLCDSCNRGLGYFKDNIQIFLNAVNYLKKNNN